jgi:hypothetical protein
VADEKKWKKSEKVVGAKTPSLIPAAEVAERKAVRAVT